MYGPTRWSINLMLPGAKLWFGAHHLTLRLAHVAHVVVTAHVAHGADLSLGRKIEWQRRKVHNQAGSS
jgi:hypothetical protein